MCGYSCINCNACIDMQVQGPTDFMHAILKIDVSNCVLFPIPLFVFFLRIVCTHTTRYAVSIIRAGLQNGCLCLLVIRVFFFNKKKISLIENNLEIQQILWKNECPIVYFKQWFVCQKLSIS